MRDLNGDEDEKGGRRGEREMEGSERRSTFHKKKKFKTNLVISRVRAM